MFVFLYNITLKLWIYVCVFVLWRKIIIFAVLRCYAYKYMMVSECYWFEALQIQMEGQLMQSTGNHPLNLYTNGKIEAPKYQIPCGYMKLMLELVDPSQKFPHSMISQTRLFFLSMERGWVRKGIHGTYLPCITSSLEFLLLLNNAGSSLHKGSWIQCNPVDWSCRT